MVPWIVGVAVSVDPGPAQSQSNLDAGKSPEQIFSDNCGACHGAPHELKPTDAAYLRKHYTTGARQAAAMAAYLEAAIKNPPAMTAAAAKPRRPSESMEETTPAMAAATAGPGQASLPQAAAAAVPVDELEE
jgi:mono/diheme cytochrome c family protein